MERAEIVISSIYCKLLPINNSFYSIESKRLEEILLFISVASNLHSLAVLFFSYFRFIELTLFSIGFKEIESIFDLILIIFLEYLAHRFYQLLLLLFCFKLGIFFIVIAIVAILRDKIAFFFLDQERIFIQICWNALLLLLLRLLMLLLFIDRIISGFIIHIV